MCRAKQHLWGSVPQRDNLIWLPAKMKRYKLYEEKLSIWITDQSTKELATMAPFLE